MSEITRWLETLEPSFLFLLALPFAVAAAGLAAELVRRRRRAPEREPGQSSIGSHVKIG